MRQGLLLCTDRSQRLAPREPRRGRGAAQLVREAVGLHQPLGLRGQLQLPDRRLVDRLVICAVVGIGLGLGLSLGWSRREARVVCRGCDRTLVHELARGRPEIIAAPRRAWRGGLRVSPSLLLCVDLFGVRGAHSSHLPSSPIMHSSPEDSRASLFLPSFATYANAATPTTGMPTCTGLESAA